jgi:Coenzyme PQQ synthesis protein D (PqqD)
MRQFPPPEPGQIRQLGHSLDHMLQISDTIRRSETADGEILLDVHHGQMFCMNVVGAKILELMQRGYDESRIADEISRDYGVNKEVVRADVSEFIEILHKHHILQPVRPAKLT